ncbi:hypothetical protein L873DRAFT_1821483 [Choiromyces venosus 120613-1]|uniref:Uncharacterized protein n=1 Tax=Choiromyces venosus 120613-1 TaxID=1336337 RepID=A0A3N4J1C4_9PEZI|nr:hypothetical protein L873DRAFT_1821483 [Choiromyces venosus 120613-1]
MISRYTTVYKKKKKKKKIRSTIDWPGGELYIVIIVPISSKIAARTCKYKISPS